MKIREIKVSKLTENILLDIREERRHQIACEHGGDTAAFDKNNTQNDWIAYISAYSGRAAQKIARNERENCNFRENMVKVATLAVAAIEAHDQGFC